MHDAKMNMSDFSEETASTSTREKKKICEQAKIMVSQGPTLGAVSSNPEISKSLIPEPVNPLNGNQTKI